MNIVRADTKYIGYVVATMVTQWTAVNMQLIRNITCNAHRPYYKKKRRTLPASYCGWVGGTRSEASLGGQSVSHGMFVYRDSTFTILIKVWELNKDRRSEGFGLWTV